MTFKLVSVFALCLLAQPVVAGPLEDGLIAYNRADYVTALQILRPLAEHGNAVAQVKLGYMYLTGNGVSRDRSAAIKWWALGSGEAADGRAAFSVAEAYFKGKDGVEQDYTTAMRYYRIAASQGSAGARNMLNNMYVDSKGIGHRYDIAIVLFRHSPETAGADSQLRVGDLYFAGNGAPQDYSMALTWYLLAAKQGLSDAQLRLGGMYFEGKGVPQDFITAHMWFNLASSSADQAKREPAVSGRDHLESKMTPDQLAEAQKLAREWLAAHPQP